MTNTADQESPTVSKYFFRRSSLNRTLQPITNNMSETNTQPERRRSQRTAKTNASEKFKSDNSTSIEENKDIRPETKKPIPRSKQSKRMKTEPIKREKEQSFTEQILNDSQPAVESEYFRKKVNHIIPDEANNVSDDDEKPLSSMHASDSPVTARDTKSQPRDTKQVSDLSTAARDVQTIPRDMESLSELSYSSKSDSDSDFDSGSEKKSRRKNKKPVKSRKRKSQSKSDNNAGNEVLVSEVPAKKRISRVGNSAKPAILSEETKSKFDSTKMKKESRSKQPGEKSKPAAKKTGAKSKKQTGAGDSSSESEWEEISHGGSGHVAGELKPMTVVVEQKQKKNYLVDLIKQHLRQARKTRQVNIHKVYLLCFIASGIHRSTCCSAPEIQAILLSITPKEFVNKKTWNQASLSSFTEWFKKTFHINTKQSSGDPEEPVSANGLLSTVESRKPGSYEKSVLLFVAILRALGLQCRLTWNCTNYPVIKSSPIVSDSEISTKLSKSDKQTTQSGENMTQSQSSQDGVNDNQSSDEEDFATCPVPVATDDIRAMLMNNESFNVPATASSNKSVIKTPVDNSKKISKAKTNAKKQKDDEKKDLKETKKKTTAGFDLWAEVFIENCKWCSVSLEGTSGIINKPYVLEKHATQPVAYVFTFDNENSVKDVTKRYAIRWGNYNRKLRVDWLDKNSCYWLSDLLYSYKSSNQVVDAQDDANIADQMKNLPVPVSISEAKDHTLYVLERHLLKFEVLHPKDAPILGYIKNEPIFSRSNVKLCHTEQNWLKEGMAIKQREQPVKYVRPIVTKQKLRKLGKISADEVPLIGIYGDWQVERYKSPPVEDGKIPRNSYGNVELFKPWMIPPGGVYITDLPGLDCVAKDLDVDCVPAMIGWDFGTGFHARPVIEGFVVCAENEDLLRQVWQVRQDEAAMKSREARAVSNWKRLMKAWRIRQVLKRKYEYTNTLDAVLDEDREEI